MSKFRTLTVGVICCAALACSNTASDDPSMYLTGTEELPSYNGTGSAPSCSGHKVLICHFPPGNRANAHTLCVGAPAVAPHVQQHQDTVGACGAGSASSCDPTLVLQGTEEEPSKGLHGAPLCDGKKVLICHIPPGNPANAHTICVGKPAEAAHVANHGDNLGACPATDGGAAAPSSCAGPPDACIGNLECSSGICVNRVCKSGGGAPCAQNGDCGSNVCVGGFCDGLPDGAACTASAACESTLCWDSVCRPAIP